jgi:hypothetical protein
MTEILRDALRRMLAAYAPRADETAAKEGEGSLHSAVRAARAALKETEPKTFTVLLMMPDWYRSKCASESDWVRTVSAIKAESPTAAATEAAAFIARAIEGNADDLVPLACYAGEPENLL